MYEESVNLRGTYEKTHHSQVTRIAQSTYKARSRGAWVVATLEGMIGQTIEEFP